MDDCFKLAKNFKNLPNIKLSGQTFNSVHLESFLKSDYGQQLGNNTHKQDTHQDIPKTDSSNLRFSR